MDPNPPDHDDDTSAANPPTYLEASGGLFNGRFDKSDFKGCGTLFAWFAAFGLIAGCFKQRADTREIVALQTLINNVHTLLEKGKVRQAMELLEEREREMDWQAMREAD